jgi:3-methyladenine DNA glycosylase AlkD
MKIANDIRAELKKAADKKTKAGFQRFFKEPVRAYGVKTGLVGKIAAKYWKEARELPKNRLFALCEELLSSDYTEDAFVVSFWGAKFDGMTEFKDLMVFGKWINGYINNWAKCDSFCNHAIGDFVQKFPDSIKEIKNWGKSNNCWMRRACAVSLIIPAKRGKFLKDAFEIADILLEDKEDMVQKGYGWLLKEASRLHTKKVFSYIMENKGRMPRIALRYAIELIPKELRSKAMQK